MTNEAAHLLDLRNVSIVFGGLRAVSNVNMHIDEHELVGLIGPNGAGKTTAFNMITGVYEPTEGEIDFDGKRVNGKKSYQVTQMGMARTFQNIRLFSELSVLDNVKIAFNMHIHYNLLEAVVRDGKYFKEEADVTEKAMELLKIFHLDGHADDRAKNLPYGAQRRLEIARALATQPKLLLLDEHTAALDPNTAAKVLEISDRLIRENRLTALMITHNMKDAIAHGNRLIMMNEGHIIYDVKGEEKKNLKVSDLLEKFSEASNGEFANDRMMLG